MSAPVATAVFSMLPVSASAWVTAYVPVQVVDAPAAKVVTGQVMVGTGPAGAGNVSATAIELTVEAPELVTRKEKPTVCPAAVTVVGPADLTSVSAGRMTGTGTLADAVTVRLSESVPLTVAELALPLTGAVAVQV